MANTPDIASIAALVGDASRAAMLTALMDGRAHTATELALQSGVTPATASSHLSRLTGAGLLSIARQGRHRYFRIATPEVAAAVEALMSIAPPGQKRTIRTGPVDERLRRARVCYDHLAGEVGVGLLERLRERQIIGGGDHEMALTAVGEAWCARVGIDVDALGAKRRRICRSCLDWSERRTHLAGALGSALMERMLAIGYARREPGSRAVILSPRGESFIQRPELA